MVVTIWHDNNILNATSTWHCRIIRIPKHTSCSDDSNMYFVPTLALLDHIAGERLIIAARYKIRINNCIAHGYDILRYSDDASTYLYYSIPVRFSSNNYVLIENRSVIMYTVPTYNRKLITRWYYNIISNVILCTRFVHDGVTLMKYNERSPPTPASSDGCIDDLNDPYFEHDRCRQYSVKLTVVFYRSCRAVPSRRRLLLSMV